MKTISEITLPAHRADRPDTWNSLNVLIAAQAFCRRHHMGHSTFGRRAAGDPSLIPDMLRGRVLRPETERRVRDFILNRRPAHTGGLPRLRRRSDDSASVGTGEFARHRQRMAAGSAALLAAIFLAPREA